MSGGADVGGDGSVQWHVWGDNVKPGHLLNRPVPPRGHEQGHVDDTAADVTKFKVSIEIPLDPTKAGAFVTSFVQAAANAQAAAPGDRVNFELPIVAEDYDQIRIRWDNSPLAPGKHAHAMAAIIAAAGKKKAAGGSKKAAVGTKKAAGSKKRKSGKGRRRR